MVGIRFELTVDGEKQLDRALSRFGEAFVDPREFFEEASDMLQGFVGQQFGSQGGRTSGWAALSPKYAAWKLRRVGPKPILTFTDLLQDSLSGENAYSIREKGRDSMRWGTSVPYAIFHQRGTRKMPARKIIDLTDDDRRSLMKALQKFLVSAGFRGAGI